MAGSQRVIHDHGDLMIVTVQSGNRWQVVQAVMEGFVGFGDFRQKTLTELYTDEWFDSDGEAMESASGKLGIRLQASGVDRKFQLRKTGFRNFCSLVAVS